jgi:hypothetical protein
MNKNNRPVVCKRYVIVTSNPNVSFDSADL